MSEKVLLVVMDGIGYSKTGLGDAVTLANTPVLDKLLKECPNVRLKAHGSAVGLPSDDDMGNSEVGHNALGCGQVYSQGAKLVNESIESGKIYSSTAWKEIAGNCVEKNSTLHFIGLLSDGNVHSNISHLIEMVKKAKADGVKNVRAHVLLDGRDVPPSSGKDFVAECVDKMAEIGTKLVSAISGGAKWLLGEAKYELEDRFEFNCYQLAVFREKYSAQ